MNKDAEKNYNNLDITTKTRVGFPNTYFMLTIDQQDFIDSLFTPAKKLSSRNDIRDIKSLLQDAIDSLSDLEE